MAERVTREQQDDILRKEKTVFDPLTRRSIIAPHSNGGWCFGCGKHAYMTVVRLFPGSRAVEARDSCGWLGCTEIALRSLGFQVCGECGEWNCERPHRERRQAFLDKQASEAREGEE